ncbi:MAG: hypothetical protein IPO65_15525 [Saprospiraceae bacterium]|nr:hypothetical protein [Saprospiraceae bacterium]
MRAHVKVLEYILNNGAVNKYTTLLEPEWIYGKLKYNAMEIEGRMNYLSTNLPDKLRTTGPAIHPPL